MRKLLTVLWVLLVVVLPSQAQELEDRMFLGVYDPHGLFDNSTMDVEMGFFDWVDTQAIEAFLNETQAMGRIPIVSLEPWTTYGTDVLVDTTLGANDSILLSLVEVFNRHRGPIWVRWAQEPELTGLYPWSQGWPRKYADAFRHVAETLRQSPNVTQMVFAPAGNQAGTYYYPGDAFVDSISFTLLTDTHWDTQILGFQSPQPFRHFLMDKYLQYTQFGKPIFIGELGVSRENPDERQAWLDQAMVELQSGNWPHLVGVVYFNARNAETIYTDHLPEWTLDPENFWTPAEMPEIDGGEK